MGRLTHFTLIAALALTGCGGTPTGDDDSAELADNEGIATREDGWLRGDFHLHTEHSDGWDTVATTLDLAAYLDDETFLAHHPEYTGNQLDLIALTDHRTVDQNFDAAFASDELILIPGEEFGGDGHAGCLGIETFVDHDPDSDGTTTTDILAAVDDAHGQGGLFSPNHPMLAGTPWRWNAWDVDALEIWNAGWALASPESTEETLTSWEEAHGPASPYFRRAAQLEGATASGETLLLYEALLSRGVHLAVIGGSDRHVALLPGFPTTYVQTDQADGDGVLDGIRQRHTFVARNPAAAQVLMEVESEGQTYRMGDEIPVHPAGQQVALRIEVARAAGGRLTLMSGGYVEDDDLLETATLGTALFDGVIEGTSDFELDLLVDVAPGDWIYPIVREPLLAPGLSEEDQAMVLQMAEGAAASSDDVGELITVLAPILDIELFDDPTGCDPDDWQPNRMQCALADQVGMGSFFVPDMLDRAMHVIVEDDQMTDWCMGAIGSAILFTESQ